jgi:hypothetical protein
VVEEEAGISLLEENNFLGRVDEGAIKDDDDLLITDWMCFVNQERIGRMQRGFVSY